MEFRQYTDSEDDPVARFYRENHSKQTLAFARTKQQQYNDHELQSLGVWEACEWLDTLVDESDPDTSLSQLEHLLQTAEALRHDGMPRWMQLVGLIHDLGKVLCLVGEPQWAVVGDTFPLGCRFDRSIVYHDFFAQNPDLNVPEFQSKHGIYEPNCGLDAVTMSWGHDEYLYQVVKLYLPPEALYIIRYHSFYAAHSGGAYQHLMNDQDEKLMTWVRQFQPYDLYSKAASPPDVEALRPYYESLIKEYFPPSIRW